MLLARRGFDVIAIDRAAYGSDTLSTHALMRAGVLQLHRWGILPAVVAAGTPAVRTTAFHYADEAIEIPIKPRDGVDALYAPRRYLLDRLLVDAARAAGAHVVHGMRLTSLVRSAEGRVTGAVVERTGDAPITIAADLVIGADGVQSTVARLAGADVVEAAQHTAAVVFGYWSGLDVEGYHWYFREGVSGGAIPTNDGLTCVFASMPPGRFHDEIRRDLAAGFHRVLAESAPQLAEQLQGAVRHGPLRGHPAPRGFFRQPCGAGWALVGDASYFKDPITAHGISDAFRDAELLARAAAPGSAAALQSYAVNRAALSRELFHVTDFIASYTWTLDSVKRAHLQLSDAMSREVREMSALWDTLPQTGPVQEPAIQHG